MNEQLKQFPVYYLFRGQLERIEIDLNSFSHYLLEIHHYIKEQQFYRYPERYQGMQKLILLPKQMHKDLHSAMSDVRFYDKWKIERKKLLYRQRSMEWKNENEDDREEINQRNYIHSDYLMSSCRL